MGRYLLFLILVCVKGDFVWGQTKDVILEREQQTEDSLILALGNIPAFTIYKDNYIITGTNFEGGKLRNTIRTQSFKSVSGTDFTENYYLIGCILS